MSERDHIVTLPELRKALKQADYVYTVVMMGNCDLSVRISKAEAERLFKQIEATWGPHSDALDCSGYGLMLNGDLHLGGL